VNHPQEDARAQLQAFFHDGVYIINHTWVGPFRTCALQLLDMMVSDDETECASATLALFILPGVVYKANKYFQFATPTQAHALRPERAVDILRRFVSADDMAFLSCRTPRSS
jgi:hypothetical protein